MSWQGKLLSWTTPKGIIMLNPCVNFNTTNSFISTSKSKKTRYINADESITKALSASTLKVYLALRFETDFKKIVACIKKTAQEIADAAGIGRTRTFKAFNELENAGLLQRENTRDRRTTYFVAKKLGHFTTPTPVHNVNGTVHKMDTYQYSFQEFYNRWGIEYDLDKESTQFDLKQNRNELYQSYADYELQCSQLPKQEKSDYQNNQT